MPINEKSISFDAKFISVNAKFSVVYHTGSTSSSCVPSNATNNIRWQHEPVTTASKESTSAWKRTGRVLQRRQRLLNSVVVLRRHKLLESNTRSDRRHHCTAGDNHGGVLPADSNCHTHQ